jgi:hypothetical protein
MRRISQEPCQETTENEAADEPARGEE